MKEINEIVGINLKKFRNEKGLTLDQVAEQAGVSKSMVGEIERGTKSPTISTLWKICNGINIPFSELMKMEDEDVSLVTNEDIRHFTVQEGFDMFVLFPYDENKHFEVFRQEIMPHTIYKSKHTGKLREYCITIKGNLIIQVGAKEYAIKEGEALQFLANVDHNYINNTDETVKVINIIYYEQKDH